MARRRRHKPLAVPDPRDMPVTDIDGLSDDGCGVAHVDGKAVFIDGAIPGDRVRFYYTKRKTSFDKAALYELIDSSPDRVEPQCPVYGVCGGCSLQHMAPEQQISTKQGILLDHFQRIGDVTPEQVLPPITGPHWHYRTKARLSCRYVAKKGSVLVGFKEKGGRYVVVMNQCEILDQRVSDLLPALKAMLMQFSDRGSVAQVEVAATGNEVALVFRNVSELTANDKTLLVNFADVHSVKIFLQPGGLDTVHLFHPQGNPMMTYALGQFGLTFEYWPMNFTQVNEEVNAKMIDQALTLLEPKQGERVFDLFCGIGNFTLPVATSGASVLGIEGEAALIERATANAKLNRLMDRVEFRVDDLYAIGDDDLKKLGKVDKILLDPPRSGAREICEKMSLLKPRRLVYVSCNPATLARDAGVLVHNHGYRLTHAGVMDMFPHTTHVESMAVFDAPG